jgi:hypothetical protein
MQTDRVIDGVSLRIDSAAALKLANKTEHLVVPGMEDDHVVALDVFYQIHCLVCFSPVQSPIFTPEPRKRSLHPMKNIIRQAFYHHRYNYSFYYHDGTVKSEKCFHIDHCISSILQSLTCHADISPIWNTWVEPAKMMKPRLDIPHECRDFERVPSWAEERYVKAYGSRKKVRDGLVFDYSNIPVTSDMLYMPKLDISSDFLPGGVEGK